MWPSRTMSLYAVRNLFFDPSGFACGVTHWSRSRFVVTFVFPAPCGLEALCANLAGPFLGSPWPDTGLPLNNGCVQRNL